MAELRGTRDRGRPRAGRGVAVLLNVYARCIDEQADTANRRITDTLDARPDPGVEEDDDSAQAS